MISVLILTRNEEENLPRCLQSVEWCDDVVVFDSFSTDRTAQIAQAAGARVIKRAFDNYASQRNAALKEVDYKHPWLLILDADECATPALLHEMLSAVRQAPANLTLFRMRRKDMLFGRWIKRSSGYPTWFGRLLRVGRVWIEREINEEYHTDGDIGHLEEHLVHYPFNKGLAHWIERHNRYSSMEASTLLLEVKGALHLSHLFSRDPVTRRKALKQLAYRLPGRPGLVFIYLYLFRLGCLDGRPGFAFCILRSIYEYMINIKTKELRMREQSLAV